MALVQRVNLHKYTHAFYLLTARSDFCRSHRLRLTFRSIHPSMCFFYIFFTAGTMQKTTYYALPIIVHDVFHFLCAAFNSTWINHNCIVLWLKITQTFQVSILCVHVFVFFFLLNLPRKPQFVGREKLRCELGLSIFILILIIIIIMRRKKKWNWDLSIRTVCVRPRIEQFVWLVHSHLRTNKTKYCYELFIEIAQWYPILGRTIHTKCLKRKLLVFYFVTVSARFCNNNSLAFR